MDSKQESGVACIQMSYLCKPQYLEIECIQKLGTCTQRGLEYLHILHIT